MIVTTIEGRNVPPQSIHTVANPPKWNMISFSHYIDPFTQLIMKGSSQLLISTVAVLEYTFCVFKVVQVVLYRLIHQPFFDPLDPAFKHQILAKDEAQVAALEKCVEELDLKFKQNHLLRQDLTALAHVNKEVSETLYRLEMYLSILQSHQNRLLHVEQDIEKVRDLYKDLDDQLTTFYQREGDQILDRFHHVLQTFTNGGMELPVDISSELVQTWIALEFSFKNRVLALQPPDFSVKLRRKLGDLKRRMEPLDKMASQVYRKEAAPLKLKNIGNSCYLDAVLQAFACIEPACRELCSPIERNPQNQDEYLKKLAIQQELIQFLDVQKMNRVSNYSQMEFILFLLGGPSLHRLREEIFKSGLHPSLDPTELTRQHDAADVAGLLIDQLLPGSKFKWQEGAATTDDVFPGIQFNGPVELQTTLQLPLRKQKGLHEMIHWVLHKHYEVEDKPPYRTFDPKSKDAQVIDEGAAADIVDLSPRSEKKFIRWYRLKELPTVLTLQVKRFNARFGKSGVSMVKDSRPVELPQDGIVDLSRYYDAPPNAPKDAKYKIKSYVVHSGSYSGGHYVAYVEIDGKYYLCDDLDSNYYREISRKDFYDNKDAYLVVLERI